MNKKVTAAVAVTGVAAAIVVGGYALPAMAYPPGKHLTVTASDPTSTKPFTFTVTVSQGLPGARVRIAVYASKGGKKLGEIVTTLGPDGKATVTFTLKLKDPDDLKTLRIRAVVLSDTNPEKATTVIVISGRGVGADKNAYTGTPFSATASGFTPNTAITLTAVRGKDKIVVTGTTDANGKFTGSFTVTTPGHWTIVATSGGKSAEYDVKVLPN